MEFRAERSGRTRRTRIEAARERRGQAMATAPAAPRYSPGPTPTASPPRPVSRPRRTVLGTRPSPRRAASAPAARRRRYDQALTWPQVQIALPSLPRVHLDWRMASLTISVLLGAVLFYVMSTPDYFVDSIVLAGAQHVPGEEIYSAAQIDRLNVFWVDPASAEQNIAAVPGIASAIVAVGWPNEVYVQVVEHEPAVLWEQGGETAWVDADGQSFPARGDVAGLLPIAVDDAAAPLGSSGRVPREAVQGALQLRRLRPNIELLHYDSMRGLSYQDGRGWRGYFGVGANMDVKLAVYETLVADLLARGFHPQMVDVENPDAPYYRK